MPDSLFEAVVFGGACALGKAAATKILQMGEDEPEKAKSQGGAFEDLDMLGAETLEEAAAADRKRGC